MKELEGKILPDGTVDSSASKELARLRRSTERLRGEVQATLEKLVLKLSRDQVLQESVVTLRNDRFVLPVRTEEKRRIGGVIHGASSSGATVFVEPLETVPLNNELVELGEREWAEVQRILAEFSAKLREQRAELGAAAETSERARSYFCQGGIRARLRLLPARLSEPAATLVGLALKDRPSPASGKSTACAEAQVGAHHH